MKQGDREAFERWCRAEGIRTHRHHLFDDNDEPYESYVHKEAIDAEKIWQAALAHRDAERDALVEAVQAILDSGTIMAGPSNPVWGAVAQARAAIASATGGEG